MKKYLIRTILSLSFFLVLLTVDAIGEDLKINVQENADGFWISNLGECIIYKLSVETIPVKKENQGFFDSIKQSMLSNNFSKFIGKLTNRRKIFIKKADMTNTDGRIFTNEFKIEGLKISGSTCGECNLTIYYQID